MISNPSVLQACDVKAGRDLGDNSYFPGIPARGGPGQVGFQSSAACREKAARRSLYLRPPTPRPSSTTQAGLQVAEKLEASDVLSTILLFVPPLHVDLKTDLV